MPYINLKTTEKLDTGATEALKSALGEAIALIPGKSERWLMINLDGECTMALSGEMGKCAMLEVEIFGKATSEAYDALTKRLCDTVSNVLDIPSDRIYIKYAEVGHWGYNGFNF